MEGEKSVLEGFATIKVIAKKFSVSRSYLKSLEAKKIINFRRLGGKIFIKLSEIEKALEDACKGCKK